MPVRGGRAGRQPCPQCPLAAALCSPSPQAPRARPAVRRLRDGHFPAESRSCAYGGWARNGEAEWRGWAVAARCAGCERRRGALLPSGSGHQVAGLGYCCLPLSVDDALASDLSSLSVAEFR